MRFNTPLRYPGGKGKLTGYIKLILNQNNLVGGNYIEPYAGGAGIALTLLLDKYVSRIHLNDLNPEVYTFWRIVLDEPDALCKLIADTDVTIEEWHRQKAVFADPLNHSPLEVAFSTFFLNRTNRSGIILGGVIGGKNQDGIWKLDARFNKPELIERVDRVARYRSDIRLYNLDAANFITDILPTLPNKSLVYLDPPYYVKGKGLYQNHYLHDDHVIIAGKVKNEITLPWVVSYDHAPEITEMYKGCPTLLYGINYSAQKKYQGAEVMFFSENLNIPEIKNPANIKAA